MKDWADLIRAIATLLWPLLAFAGLYLFKDQARELVSRLRPGKLLGQEIELEEKLRALNENAQAAASETPSSSAPAMGSEAIA